MRIHSFISHSLLICYIVVLFNLDLNSLCIVAPAPVVKIVSKNSIFITGKLGNHNNCNRNNYYFLHRVSQVIKALRVPKVRQVIPEYQELMVPQEQVALKVPRVKLDHPGHLVQHRVVATRFIV